MGDTGLGEVRKPKEEGLRGWGRARLDGVPGQRSNSISQLTSFSPSGYLEYSVSLQAVSPVNIKW